MKLSAQPVPYSSVVGSGIMLCDEGGAVVAQLAVMVPDPGRDYQETAKEVTRQIVEAFNGRAEES